MPETDKDNDMNAPDDEQAAQEEVVVGDQEDEQEADEPQVSVERTGPCECVIRIEASADYLRDRYQQELASLQREVKLPGFRRGRAPIGLVERRLGTTIKSDLISSVVGECYERAVDENDLTVVADTEAPDLEDVSWQPGQPADFTFRCEVMPQVEVEESRYKGLKVDAPALAVTDELMEAEKGRFAQQFATWEEVSGEGIDWDDYVEARVSVPDADWSSMIGFFPRSEKIGPLEVEGLKGLLAGAKLGDELEAEARVDEEGAGSEAALAPLAGQTVKVQIAIERATRRKVPDVDDELAKKLGMSGVDEIEQMVQERLEGALAQRKNEIAQQMVIDRLLETLTFELPESLVERAAEEEQLRTLVRLLRAGLPRHEAEERAASGADRTREAVERRLKASFLLRQIAEKERILVTESEVDGQIRAFAARQGWREERAKSYMDERGILRSLREDMRESKVTEFLLEKAEVEEISPEEFGKRHGASDQDEAEPADEE